MSQRLALALDRLGSDLQPEAAILGPLGITVEYASPEPDRRCRQLGQAEAVLLNRTIVDAGFFDAAPRCRVIVTYGVGHDHIDLHEAERRGVIVANVPDYCTEEVADHTLALLLAVARGIGRGDALLRGGGWGVDGIGPLHRLRGRVLGLVGYGRIARAVATRAQAFGLTVLAYDPALSQTSLNGGSVRLLDSLRALLTESDAVSLHLPLSPQTRGLISGPALFQMKPGAILINTSRGALVDLPALLKALDDGQLAGAGLDVFPDEPPDLESISRPNLVVTPHIGYYSVESLQELKESAARAVADALTGAPVANQLTATASVEKELVS
ncbi:MAG: D-3-phosphoglycerate dehydrogenase / 2-oxoglutarate reductase [Chloroflexota bacterium]|nr:D-3-phosphoglycerate dehydrogenase / 2-oxoglutarate reductase [Chloroflexota bacterium]